MADPQTLIREAQEKAERLCRLAVEQTPAEYQSFITLIEQRKKVGGTRAAPIFATVRQPYLSVDGRVKRARDEHREAGKRFDVQTEFVVEPTSGQLLARATLTSEIYGTVVAHARVFLGGDGVNESNPLENGETSRRGARPGHVGLRLLRDRDRLGGRGAARGRAARLARARARRRLGRPTACPDPAAAATVAPATSRTTPPRPSWRDSARRSASGPARWRSGGRRRPPTRTRSTRSAAS